MNDTKDKILYDLYSQWIAPLNEVPVQDAEYQEIITQLSEVMSALQNSLTDAQRPLFMRLDGIYGQRLAWEAENRFVEGMHCGAQLLCALLKP